MQIGIVGLGRMGGNMARRLMRGGHEVVALATDAAAVQQLASEGATGTSTIEELVGTLRAPRVAWAMVPAGAATEQVVRDLGRRMEAGDTIVDGGNSHYILVNARSQELAPDLRYDLNLRDIAEVWRRGSVIGSWLLDLAARALTEEPSLSHYTGIVEDSGEGRWTIMAAIEEGVPADVLSAALYVRFRSRREHTFAEKVLSAMREKFGGHVEQPSGG